MIRIYLETEKPATPERVFVNTILCHLKVDMNEFEIICVGGKDNLRNVINKMKETVIQDHGCNLVIFDADGIENGGGFEKRKSEIETLLASSGVNADLFLWPNNKDDGDFETLVEKLIRQDLHKQFLYCFHDYEACLGKEYLSPNRKGKLHTFVSAQKGLSKKQRDGLGKGEWMFDNPNLWNLNSQELESLKDFLNKYLMS